jgi:hypothetical protein
MAARRQVVAHSDYDPFARSQDEVIQEIERQEARRGVQTVAGQDYMPF